MRLKDWPAYPHQVDALVRTWKRDYPDKLRADSMQQYTGHRVHALTVTDWSTGTDGKRGLICAVPHAHEPASTVGIMDFLSELLTGRHLDRSSSDLDAQAILSTCLLTFIPDANPGGRTRSPEPFWDGSRHDNHGFLSYAFGIDAATEDRFKRVARWSMLEDVPARLGLVYEQVNEHEYVEPNRDQGSSLVRLSRQTSSEYQYHCQVHLHQTEFDWAARDPTNCMAILPTLQSELAPPLQEANLALARRMIALWRDVGGHPLPDPRGFEYGEPHRQWFVDSWGEVEKQIPCIIVEVQNNNPNTSPHQQMVLSSAGLRAAVDWLLEGA